MYGHPTASHMLELDACLTGLGGHWRQQVYHLPIPPGYQSMSIVHLEMANILVTCKLFSNQWQGSRLLINGPETHC